jgi:hypothetical protein
VVNAVVSRVKNEYELRLGHEKIGCPSCHHDCWVSREQQKDIDKGAAMICRECWRS